MHVCIYTSASPSLSPWFSVYSSLFFWTRNEGPQTGSRQKHNRITVIIYITMTKLNEDREKGDTSSWPNRRARLTKQTVTKQWTNATDILQSVQTKSKLLLCVSSSPLGTQRDFHVNALCVEDPSPPSTPSIDAIRRRHHSKPLSTPTIEAIHRRRQSSPPTSPYLTTHQLPLHVGSSPQTRSENNQLLLHFGITNPSRTSGSAVNPVLFRRRAQPFFHW